MLAETNRVKLRINPYSLVKLKLLHTRRITSLHTNNLNTPITNLTSNLTPNPITNPISNPKLNLTSNPITNTIPNSPSLLPLLPPTRASS